MKARSSRFSRRAHAFDAIDAAHVLVRVAEELDFDFSDPAAFVKRVQNVEFGLSAEVEFAALLRWLGRCIVVHRLSEMAFIDESLVGHKVPDLVAVFRANGVTLPILIEVKTTREAKLEFREDYLAGLKAHADLLNHALLIAWRPRCLGFWMLLDPSQAAPCGRGKLAFTLANALPNDLLCELAGDYFLVPTKGAGLRIDAERVSEPISTENGFQATFRINSAHYCDALGKQYVEVPEPILCSMLSVLETEEDVTNDKLSLLYRASGGTTRAQMVLRSALAFFLKDGEKINWKTFAGSAHSFSCADLHESATTHLGTFISYVIHQQPASWPSFISPAFRTKPAR